MSRRFRLLRLLPPYCLSVALLQLPGPSVALMSGHAQTSARALAPAQIVTPEPDQVFPTVFVVAFPSYGPPLASYDSMTRELIGDLREASTYHGTRNPGAKAYLNYQLYEDKVIVDPKPPAVLPGGDADYSSIYERYGLCPLIAARQVDEVWFIVAGDGDRVTRGGMPEWVVNGPAWADRRFAGTAAAVRDPDCGRTVTTMMFHYGLDLGFALHSFGHRMEGFFMTRFPCEFITESWPWKGRDANWLEACPDLDRDRLAFVARPFAGNDQLAGCGDVHTPPNITSDTAYVYNSHLPARSTCADWSMDGSAAVQTVSCADWGCTQLGYLTWWMQNVPGPHNTNRDAAGQPQPNWYATLFQDPPPLSAEPPDLPRPTPRASLLFEDAFDGQRDPLWHDASGTWSVRDGMLNQRASGDEAQSFVPSVTAVDSRVEARIRILNDVAYGADEERAAGLILRVQNADNLVLAHLRLAKPSGPDRWPSVSMWRRRNGEWSGLASAAYPIRADTWYTVRFESLGSRLFLYLNDERVLAARDTPLPAGISGTAGVRASQVHAHFDDFRFWRLDLPVPTPHEDRPTVTPAAGSPTVTPGAGSPTVTPWVGGQPTPTTLEPVASPTPTPSPTPSAHHPQALVLYLPAVVRNRGLGEGLGVSFLGQDGAGYVGGDCTENPVPDNIHLRLSGLPPGTQVVEFQVLDPTGQGLWVFPCNHVNWWLKPIPAGPGGYDLYMKPFRDAPERTTYEVFVKLADGSTEEASVVGSAVRLRP